jgi:outer membrane protein TolC
MQQAQSLAQKRYASGKLDVLRLLSVHRAAAQLQLQRLDLLHDLQVAVIDVGALVGRPLAGRATRGEVAR